MRIIQVKCDECQVIRQESNHWYALVIDTFKLTIIPLEKLTTHKILTKHLCGEKCLHDAISKNLPGVKDEKKCVGTRIEKN